MNQIIKKGLVFYVLTTCLFIISSTPALAQLVAFTGKDSNSPDEFAFVALQTLTTGTQIFFTENDYDNTAGTFATSEGTLVFTVGATALTVGTVVQISETAADTFTLTGNDGTAVLVGGSSWSTTSGDPHYAFSASNGSDPWNTVTEVHAMLFATNAAFGTLDPSTGTSSHPNAIVVDNGFSGVQVAVDFTGDRTMATHVTLADSGNFTEGDGSMDLTFFNSVPVELMNFSIQ